MYTKGELIANINVCFVFCLLKEVTKKVMLPWKLQFGKWKRKGMKKSANWSKECEPRNVLGTWNKCLLAREISCLIESSAN